ncbi:MAG: hypothetical protein AAFN42_00670 [Cyanobacteria bacterium J06554_1]
MANADCLPAQILNSGLITVVRVSTGIFCLIAVTYASGQKLLPRAYDGNLGNVI